MCVLFAQSCASTSERHIWIGEGIRAEAVQERGDFGEAETIYNRLLSSPPDVTRGRWIAYKLAELASDQGDPGEARKRASAIHGEKIIDKFGAKALFLMAEIDEDDSLFWEVISTYPGTYSAEKSLKYLEQQSKINAQRADFAVRLRREIDKTDGLIKDNLLLAEARVYIENNQPNKALSVLRELFYLDETASLSDNALWEIAALYRNAQQWRDALGVYLIYRDRIESSWYVGSYTPHLVDDSIFESGKISLLFLQDYTLAASYFEDYLVLFPDGILADDALWFLAESYRLSGHSEKRDDALDRLDESFPTSKFQRRQRGVKE